MRRAAPASRHAELQAGGQGEVGRWGLQKIPSGKWGKEEDEWGKEEENTCSLGWLRAAESEGQGLTGRTIIMLHEKE